tara:strand:- start:101 stop:1246 length:1146 start_codon:yes stop_codon:yes gene_type:complete
MNQIENIKKGVIVLGGHVQALGIIRILGNENIPSILLDDSHINIARFSKYCGDFFLYSDLMKKLIELGKLEKYKNWLILPTNDFHVSEISKNKKELLKYFKVGSDDWSNIEKFYNKKNAYKIAKKIGIDIPETWFPKSIDDLPVHSINYPCIIKPAVMHKFYKITKKKVFICNNKQELLNNYKKALKVISSNEILIQDIIPGSSENLYSACFTFDKEKSLVQLVCRRKRQHPVNFGNATTFAETFRDEKLIEISEKLLKEVKYDGICEVEYKFDKRDQRYKFLEINTRTWKWHSISIKSKSPFLISYYNKCYNLEKIVKLNFEDASFKHIITDVPTSFKMILMGIYKKTIIRNVQYATWNKKDILPAIMELLILPYLIFKR